MLYLGLFSDQRLETTMTAVYLLVPLNERKRKRDIRHRRSLIASMEVPQVIIPEQNHDGEWGYVLAVLDG